jgi:hypothetical protein
MRNVFSLYFDGTIFQAVHACISGGALTIKDARTSPYDALDDYLSGCREKNFVVCCNPALFHNDILFLPPAVSKHYDKLVRTEVQKNHPELASFTTFYSSVGLSSIENKTFNKVAAFSYDDTPLSQFLAAFTRHGKSVSRCYAAPYAIFRLLASTLPPDADQPRLFVASVPGEKLLLLGGKRGLEFIRKVPSSDPALLPSDIQNINMTLDYCLQSLRVKPVQAVLLDQSGSTAADFPLLSVPLSFARPPALASASREMASDYLAPLAAALHFLEAPESGDLRPADYARFSRSKRILATSSMVISAAALILAVRSVTEMTVISDLKSDIAEQRTALSGSSQEMAQYLKLDAELKSLSEPLENLRKQRSSPQKAAALASLTLPATPEYSFTEISIRDGAGSLEVRIEGGIASTGYGGVQATFEGIVGQIGKIPGYAISSSHLDVARKTFAIEARYRGTGKTSS